MPSTARYFLDPPPRHNGSETTVFPTNNAPHLSTFGEQDSSTSLPQEGDANGSMGFSGMEVSAAVLYTIGIIGNIMALLMLKCSVTKRNKIQTLMLKCLAYNDFFALSGSFAIMVAAKHWPKSSHSDRCVCILRLLLRVFGLGSGCVAMVMAIERWLLMSKMFSHKKHVTMTSIGCSIFALWAFVLTVVCMPLFGFGLYYDETRDLKNRCVRYRFGTEPKDRGYALLMLIFGLVLCVCIVVCNICVIKTICGCNGRSIRRVTSSRTPCARQNSANSQVLSEINEVHHTSEEVFFATLMAVLCFFFVICWLPQMISIVWGQIDSLNTDQTFYKIADFMMALNFSIDPYIYVVPRKLRNLRQRSNGNNTLGSRNASCKYTPSSSRNNSMIKDEVYQHSMDGELQALKKNSVNEHI